MIVTGRQAADRLSLCRGGSVQLRLVHCLLETASRPVGLFATIEGRKAGLVGRCEAHRLQAGPAMIHELDRFEWPSDIEAGGLNRPAPLRMFHVLLPKHCGMTLT
jgi:hypothetical protein